MKLRQIMLAALVALAPLGAQATTLTFTLPQFFNLGTGSDLPPFPVDTVGTFTGLPTVDVIGATISGAFGTSDSLGSAGVDLLLGDTLLVGQCVEGQDCFNGTKIVPWSFTLSPADFALIEQGTLDLVGHQTSIGQINLDTTTLTVEVAEPVSLGFVSLSLGFAGMALRRRQRGFSAPRQA